MTDRGRDRLSPYLTTTLTFVALIVVVLAVDSLPLTQAARGQLWGLNSLHYSEFDSKLPARRGGEWHIGMGPGELQPEAPAPEIRPASGFFSKEMTVLVDAPSEQDAVHCTSDGAIPTARDPEYVQPIAIQNTSVIRCRTFRRGHQASQTTTRTYMDDAAGSLPVLALTADPINLWNPYSGIHAQFNARGSEWERDAYVEYLPRTDDEKALAIAGKIRIHGGFSRADLKKSFRFIHEPLVDNHNRHNLFTRPTPDNADNVVIFSARDSNVSRDELFQTIYAAAGGYTSRKMPVFLHINAEPWGIYHVRERIDENWLYRTIGPGSYDLLDAQPGTPRVVVGDRMHWNRTIEFFQTADFTQPQTLAAAGDLIDLENFTDFWLFNIYAANVDWPHHNMYMFRRRDGDDNRWRWISWDTDFTFDYLGRTLNHDTLAWATRSGLRHDLRFNNERGLRDTDAFVSSTLIARRLLENPGYRARFSQRMSELLDTHLHPASVEPALLAVHAATAADLAADWKRWLAEHPSSPKQPDSYNEDLERIRQFIHTRPHILRAMFQQYFAEPSISMSTSDLADAMAAR